MIKQKTEPQIARITRVFFFICEICVICGLFLSSARGATPNLAGQLDRPLRYHPDNGDFVIENGPDTFNRSMYGSNTAFRADGGDKPEFSLFLPGRGGTMRLGIKASNSTKWLRDAKQIIARYRPGTMVYEIRDPAWGEAVVRQTAIATASIDGLVVRTEVDNAPANCELVAAYGAGDGNRGSRNGDIGTEREPVSQFFAFQPQYAAGCQFQIKGNAFDMVRGGARANSPNTDGNSPAAPNSTHIVGAMSEGSVFMVADGGKWESADELLSSAGKETATPIVVGHGAIKSGQPIYVAVQALAGNTESGLQNLSQLFDDTDAHFRAIRERVAIDTPDPYINAAMGAICIAADGIYDSVDNMYMHGAVAWRNHYLGWRGMYSGDALGWHDRTRNHLAYYIRKQNVSPIGPVKPDPNAAASGRSEAMLHTNGDMMNSHYDMNMVAIDALFRDLLWTGDLEYAKSVWPAIQRDLAWEKRLFRREFGPDKLPLYEAYAAIWASDDLQYSGGGVAHTSAYNYFHNRMAARVAKLIGQDGSAYDHEADLILKAMQTYLWLPEQGWFAECKDLLGGQLVHPAAAVWTNYHTIDSRVPDSMQAWQMGRYLDTQIPHIPVTGPGVPQGNYQLASSNWMPYLYSTNNVVMAETAHSALSEWQSAQNDQALKTYKGALLDGMYLGQCPGNLGMCTYYDDYRRESQRDFGDAIGINSRTMVEGLFGIMPDALAHELSIRPGFPRDWDHASIKHPDFSYSFNRDGQTETFVIEPRFPAPMKLRLDWQALASDVASLTVNGQPAKWTNVEDAVGWPRIQITADPAAKWEIKITWRGDAPVAAAKNPAVVAAGANFESSFGPATLVDVIDPQRTLGKIEKDKQSVRASAVGTMGYRTSFARVHQGGLTWLLPIEFEIRPAHEIVQSPVQDDSHLRFHVRNNTPVALTRSGSPLAPAYGESSEIAIDAKGMMSGTNHISLDIDGGHIEGTVINWKLPAQANASKFETIDIASAINDRVTRIFSNDYLSPRSPFTSLAIPKSGLGGWAGGAPRVQLDDSGLREASTKNNGRFVLPQGIPFSTPGTGEAKNIAFVSQWDNYPREASLPLSGKSSHAYLLMAGSTTNMQSRFTNGEVVVTYTDGSSERLALDNPTNWWPIEKDYLVDDYAFARPEPVPPRVDLRTATVRINDPTEIKTGRENIPGGSANVLDLPLNPQKELKSITVRAIANEVVIGLMGVTLQR